MRTQFVSLMLALVMSATLCAEKPKNAAQAAQQAGEKAEKAAASSGAEGDFVTEKRSDGTTVKYKKKTTYDFEGSNIEGLYNKPSGSYISNIKDVKGRSIIRIRENFDAEVIDSSRQLK